MNLNNILSLTKNIIQIMVKNQTILLAGRQSASLVGSFGSTVRSELLGT